MYLRSPFESPDGNYRGSVKILSNQKVLLTKVVRYWKYSNISSQAVLWVSRSWVSTPSILKIKYLLKGHFLFIVCLVSKTKITWSYPRSKNNDLKHWLWLPMTFNETLKTKLLGSCSNIKELNLGFSESCLGSRILHSIFD